MSFVAAKRTGSHHVVACLIDFEEDLTVHAIGEGQAWDPFPPVRPDDLDDRRAANRAVGLSALGLGLTGLIELAFAVLNGSVGLLGEALHNLSDVSSGAQRSGAMLRVSRRP